MGCICDQRDMEPTGMLPPEEQVMSGGMCRRRLCSSSPREHERKAPTLDGEAQNTKGLPEKQKSKHRLDPKGWGPQDRRKHRVRKPRHVSGEKGDDRDHGVLIHLGTCQVTVRKPTRGSWAPGIPG